MKSLEILDEALDAKRVKAPRPVFVPVKVLEGVNAAANRHKLITAEERATAKAADLICERIETFLLHHTHADADRAFQEHVKGIASQVAAGELDAVSAGDGWNRKEFADDFKVKRDALREEYRTACHSVWPIIQAIQCRIAEAAGLEADKLQASEDVIAQRFGEYGPSRLLMLLRGIQAYPDCLSHQSGSRPKAQLATLGIQL